jgi:hypothetical protein
MVPRDARSCIFPGFADDLNIYAALKSALKVLVEMRQLLGEDAKFSFIQHGQSQNLHPRFHQRASSRTCAPAHQLRPLARESP